jgi:hypothetical protein
MALYKVEDRVRHLAELNVASAQLIGDIFGHITGPAFGGVERHDADRQIFDEAAKFQHANLPGGTLNSLGRWLANP